MGRKEQGSITIFSLLSMVLVAATLLCLLEGARAIEINRLASLQTELALESAFANYSTNLWTEYHILGANRNKMDDILLDSANGRNGSSWTGVNMLGFQVEKMEMSSYTLLTDEDGKAYVNMVSAYMKDNILYEAAKTIYNQYEVLKNLQETSGFDISVIDEAIEALAGASESSKGTSRSVGTSGSDSETDIENPLETIRDMLTGAILDLVVEDTDTLSTIKFNQSLGVSQRVLQEGKSYEVEETDWLDKILLQQYLLNYFSNYSQEKEGHYLSYELEYLIGKKGNEKENLLTVVSQLLLIRGAANYIYLITNSEKVNQAAVVATLLVGVSGSSELIELVKIALLTAWALAEAILDIRALLKGRRISLLKADDMWTLELTNLGVLTEDFAIAKENKGGLSYDNYLGILLLFQSEKNLAMYGMDAQELTLRNTYGETDFCMDEVVMNASVRITYSYKPLFMFFKDVISIEGLSYETTTMATYGYN